MVWLTFKTVHINDMNNLWWSIFVCKYLLLISFILGTISGTTRIITTENFSVEMQLRIIEKYKVTIVEDSAYDMVLMLKSGLLPTTDLSSVKHYFAGGCKVPLSVVQEFNSYMPNGSVNVGYGL